MRLSKLLRLVAVTTTWLAQPIAAQLSVAVPNPTALPPFALQAIAPAGSPVTAEYFAGRVGVVEFWFPACQPCGPAHDALARVAGIYDQDSVRILAVDIDREASLLQALEWLDAHKPTPFPVTLDTVGFAEAMRVHGAPFVAVIDHTGRVVHWIGGVDLDTTLPPVLDRYLAVRRDKPSQAP